MMEANILCTLLAQRIPPERFQLLGIEVHWTAAEFDTPENRAIVAEVISNYESLKSVFLAERADAEEVRTIKVALAEIDLRSIRSIRTWLAGQPDAPKWIKEQETAAIAERSKLMK